MKRLGVWHRRPTTRHSSPVASHMSTTFVEARSFDSDWIGFLKRELMPTRLRQIRTAIMVGGTVLCVIISMALQVPELALSAYMIFFLSKETKALTTKTGVGGLIGVTI